MSDGMTNAKPIHPRWNMQEIQVLTRGNLEANTPVIISSRYRNASSIAIFSEGFSAVSTKRETDFSIDDKYYVTTAAASPFIKTYKRSTDSSYSLLTVNQPTADSIVTCVRFSPDGQYLLIGLTNTPYLKIYGIRDTGFTQVPFSTLGIFTPNAAVQHIVFSNDGTILYTATSTGVASIARVYRKSGTVYQSLSSTSLFYLPTDVAISPDNTKLAVTSAESPYITAYSIEASSISEISITGKVNLPHNTVAFSTDSNNFYVGINNSPARRYSFSNSTYILDRELTNTTSTIKIIVRGDDIILGLTNSVKVLNYNNSKFTDVYNYSISGSLLDVVLSNTREYLILRGNTTTTLNYKLIPIIYDVRTNPPPYIGIIEGVGFTKETSNANSIVSVIQLTDFSNIHEM